MLASPMKMAHGPWPPGSEYLYVRYDIIRHRKHCLSRLALPVRANLAIGGKVTRELCPEGEFHFAQGIPSTMGEMPLLLFGQCKEGTGRTEKRKYIRRRNDLVSVEKGTKSAEEGMQEKEDINLLADHHCHCWRGGAWTEAEDLARRPTSSLQEGR